MVRQVIDNCSCDHERNQYITVHPELIEGFISASLNPQQTPLSLRICHLMSFTSIYSTYTLISAVRFVCKRRIIH